MAEPSASLSLKELIQSQYAAFSQADRKLADVVLAREKDLLAYSATELAALAGVSKASSARFFRRLGFSDFQAFRHRQREGAAQPSPLNRMGRHGGGGPLQLHLGHDALRLQALADDVTDDSVQAAVKLLIGARRVWVVGYRNGFMAAFYARALLSQVRAGVGLLNDGSGEDAELVAEIQPNDVLLAMDFRRRTRRLSQVVGAACAQGAELVLVTDARLSRLGAQARSVFICPPQEGAIFDSYVSAISLINHLACVAVAQMPQKARTRMARIEAAHAQLGDLEA
jgi:DNA-binding MurR/RpiR family transcriptional regulator